jgi:Aldo/keto reductases, related to diketogulonate reductase
MRFLKKNDISWILGTYELETLPTSDLGRICHLVDKEKINVIDTSISYNNDWLLRKLFPLEKRFIISKIAPQMTDHYESFVSHHLRRLGVDRIDLMLIHNPRSEWRKLAESMRRDPRFKEIGTSNFGIKDLEEYKKVLGAYPIHNQIEINPMYCDLELIKFCRDNKIKVSAYAILGGKYNAPRYISNYTLQGLLSFARANSDYLILRADNGSQMEQLLKFSDYESSGETSQKILGMKDRKSIEPMEYSIPEVFGSVKIGKFEFPTYRKTDTTGSWDFHKNSFPTRTSKSEKISKIVGHVDRMKSHLADSCPPFEFVSDHHVFVINSITQFIDGEGLTGRFDFKYEHGIFRLREKSSSKKSKELIIGVYLVDEFGNLTKIRKDSNTNVVIITA